MSYLSANSDVSDLGDRWVAGVLVENRRRFSGFSTPRPNGETVVKDVLQDFCLQNLHKARLKGCAAFSPFPRERGSWEGRLH